MPGKISKDILPAGVRHRIRRGVRAASAVLYAGGEFYCPCCQRHIRKFVGPSFGLGQACPACGSLERQRLLMLYLTRYQQVFSSRLSLLHFAPEQCLYDRFSAASLLEYVTADIRDLPMVHMQFDITAIPWPDESFDLIICSHVLEHVEDDAKALQELRRVLRPGGNALLQHPIAPALERTYEDPAIIEPADRLEAFGQSDHVRRYGRDFVERLQAAGLDSQCIRIVDELSSELVNGCGLREGRKIRGEDIYVCRRASSQPPP